MAETYGTVDSGDTHVMSEKVQSLAATIYQELERMIKTYDENVVKELMPLVVGILENLDQAYQEKQENEVDLELLRDDNEQLLTQYEREKQLRKLSEQKCMEMEDSMEEERKEFQTNVEGLEATVKMLELKGKNAQDHISRLDEKEVEMKKDYSKLHERYTDLFKTHMDHMERTKLLMSGDKISDIGTSPRNRSGFHMPILKSINPGIYQTGETPVSPEGRFTDDVGVLSPRSTGSNVSLKHEMKESDIQTADRGQNTEAVSVTETSTATRTASDSTSDQTTTDTKQQTTHLQTSESEQSTIQSDSKSAETIFNSENSQSKRDTDNIAQIYVEESKTESQTAINSEGAHFDTSEQTVSPRSRPASLSGGQTGCGKLDGYVIASFTDASFEEYSFGDMLQSPDLDEMADEFNNSESSPRKPLTNTSSIYDELSMQDADGLGDMDAGVDISGMGKEVENLILENTELLATKNALNIVKDDLIAKVDELSSEQEILKDEIQGLQAAREKLKARVSELETEVKKTKEELETTKERAKQANDEGEITDQNDIPMAQRKRFTRVEMARVLMERNQYKERLMELQEAVRWTEMMRASREHPELQAHNKKKGSIWNLFQDPLHTLTNLNEQIVEQTGSWDDWYNSFSNLFSGPEKPKVRRALTGPAMQFSAPASVRPVGYQNKTNRETNLPGDKSRAFDFLQDDVLTDKARKEREKERREQYKQVRAHVKKDDGRMQAYGWSLPAKIQSPASNKDTAAGKSSVPVPVPVYCRPLLDQDPNMKIWCAAGVMIIGGRTKDGGNLIGGSVFYDNPPSESNPPTNDIEQLDKEIQDHQKDAGESEHEQLSSLVWICTTTHNSSQVTVVDANNPGQVIEAFHVSSSHILCIASVPGCDDNDFEWNDSDINCESSGRKKSASVSSNASDKSVESADSSTGIGGITFVRCVAGAVTPPEEEPTTETHSDPLGATTLDIDEVTVSKAKGSPVSPSPVAETAPTQDTNKAQEQAHSSVGLNMLTEEAIKLSTLQPTMWIGTQTGSLYVHSSVANWKKCLCSVKLKDSILAISHIKGRIFVALADGSVAVFHRAKETSQWDLTNYHLIDLGKPHHSVRCLCIVASKHMWCGYRNKIHILDPKTLQLEKSFDAHPRKESQVRQLAWVGDGVWVSIRLDSTLRLYHAYTHQHLQDVDIEPYVSKMLGTGKLGFSFVRITSLLLSCHRLWIGTGNGVIISVPLSEKNKQTVTGTTTGRPGGVVRVYSDVKTDSVTPGSFVPYCSMAQAQLSFHGHKDAVKFFVAVPGSPSRGVSGVVARKDEKGDREKLSSEKKNKDNILVISGGEGYIDFRLGDTEEDGDGPDKDSDQTTLSKGDRSHLIVWQVFHNR